MEETVDDVEEQGQEIRISADYAWLLAWLDEIDPKLRAYNEALLAWDMGGPPWPNR